MNGFESQILRSEMQDGQQKYFVHYQKWAKKYVFIVKVGDYREMLS